MDALTEKEKEKVRLGGGGREIKVGERRERERDSERKRRILQRKTERNSVKHHERQREREGVW